MSAGSADCFRFRGAYEGCISGHDSNISHRPYHKNCRCALHDKSRRLPGCPPLPSPARCNSVSFPIRRSRSDGALAFAVSTAAPAGSASPSLSPAASFMRLSDSEIWPDGDGDGDEDFLLRITN